MFRQKKSRCGATTQRSAEWRDTACERCEVPFSLSGHTERSSYVAERLKKLSPKKKDGVMRSIEAMFQFGGGIDSSEIEKVVATLQKQKFFSITPEGRVIYTKG